MDLIYTSVVSKYTKAMLRIKTKYDKDKTIHYRIITKTWTDLDDINWKNGTATLYDKKYAQISMTKGYKIYPYSKNMCTDLVKRSTINIDPIFDDFPQSCIYKFNTDVGLLCKKITDDIALFVIVSGSDYRMIARIEGWIVGKIIDVVYENLHLFHR